MREIEVDGFLADSVAQAEGKLYVQGAGWNQITAPLFPAVHDRIGIGLLVRMGADGSEGRHTFELRLIGPAEEELQLGESPNGPLTRLPGEITTGEGADHIVPIAINLNGMPLARPGDYRFVVSVDGIDRKTLPFRVLSLAAQAPPSTSVSGYL